MWRSIWSNEEHLNVMGAMTGRNTYEAVWAGLTRAGVTLPDFWDAKARTTRSEENRKGIDWFVGSGWQQRNKQLYAVAGEVERKLAQK